MDSSAKEFPTCMWTKGKIVFIYLFIFLFRIVASIIKKHCFTILANINSLNFTECIIWFHSDLVLFCNIPWERLLAAYQIHFLFNLWTKLSYFSCLFVCLFVRWSHMTSFYPMEYERGIPLPRLLLGILFALSFSVGLM